jgi:hypothetical protein
MVLQPGVLDNGASQEQPNALKAGVRLESGPKRNIWSLLGAFFDGLAEGITEAEQRPSVSWREQAARPSMTPLLDLRARQQARIRSHGPEPSRRDWLERWLELQEAERLKQLENSPENASPTKTVRGWIGPSGPDDSLDPANNMTYIEKSAPITMPGYAGEFIGNHFGSEQFTDPRVSQWYPNSAEIYEQELAQVQAQQQEQAMRLALQQPQAAMSTSSVMRQFGQKIGIQQPGQSRGVTREQKTLRRIYHEVLSHTAGHMIGENVPKLPYDTQQFLRQKSMMTAPERALLEAKKSQYPSYDWRHEPGVVDVTLPTALDIASLASLVGPTYQGLIQLPTVVKMLQSPEFWRRQLPEFGKAVLRSKQTSGFGPSLKQASSSLAQQAVLKGLSGPALRAATEFPQLANMSAFGKRLFVGEGKDTANLVSSLKEHHVSDALIQKVLKSYTELSRSASLGEVYLAKNGSVIIQIAKHSKASGSYTIYQKVINPLGETLWFGHVTYGTKGEFVHFKEILSKQLRNDLGRARIQYGFKEYQQLLNNGKTLR